MNKSNNNSVPNKIDGVQESELIYKPEKLNQTFRQQNIIGYGIDGTSVSEKEFVTDIVDALDCFAKGTLETYSSEVVKKKILG
jgi:hypothetical protein